MDIEIQEKLQRLWVLQDEASRLKKDLVWLEPDIFEGVHFKSLRIHSCLRIKGDKLLSFGGICLARKDENGVFVRQVDHGNDCYSGTIYLKNKGSGNYFSLDYSM